MSSPRITTTTKSTLFYLFAVVFPYLTAAGFFGSCVEKCGFMCCSDNEVCYNNGVCISPSTVQSRLDQIMPVDKASSVVSVFKVSPSSVLSHYVTVFTNLPVPKVGNPYSSTTKLVTDSARAKPTCTPGHSASTCEEPKETKSTTPYTSVSPSSATPTSMTSTSMASTPISTASPTPSSGNSAADSLHVGLRVVCAVAAAVVGGVAFML